MDGRVDADRYAAVDLAPFPAEKLRERLAASAQLRVEHGHLDRRFRHLVPMHGMQNGGHIGGHQVAIEQPGNQMVDQDTPRAVDVLG